jgi:hypothetical protein
MISFDDSPLIYLLTVNMLIALVACLCLLSLSESKISQKKSYIYFTLIACLLLIVYGRLPAIVLNEVYNPDENLFLVGAMTLVKDPIYWNSVDGSTSGPFNFFIISVFCEVFNQPYDYISGKIVGILLMTGSVLFNFLSIQRLFNNKIALLSILPASLFLSTTQIYDFVNYSSEQLPIFILSIMTFIYAKIYIEKNINTLLVFLFGLLAGGILFTKLQVIPIAFIITILTYFLLFSKHKASFIKLSAWLTFAGLLIPLAYFLMALKYDFLEKMWLFYIKYNLAYGNETKNIITIIYQSFDDEINIFIRVIAILSFVLLTYNIIFKRNFKPSQLSVFIISYMVFSLYCVYKTGFMFHHYLLFLISPIVFLFALFYKSAISCLSNKYYLFEFAGVINIFIVAKTIKYPLTNSFVSANAPQRPLKISNAAKEIIKYSNPDENLIIWGEDGRLYLETKRNQGIRWCHSHWGMYSNSLQKIFQHEFIKDFKEKPFPVFVDAHPTKGTFMTRDKLGYETNPELKELVENKYKLVGEFDEKRVFVRNERYKTINHIK